MTDAEGSAHCRHIGDAHWPRRRNLCPRVVVVRERRRKTGRDRPCAIDDEYLPECSDALRVLDRVLHRGQRERRVGMEPGSRARARTRPFRRGANLVEADVDGQSGARRGVVVAFENTPLTEEIHGDQRRSLEDLDHSVLPMQRF